MLMQPVSFGTFTFTLVLGLLAPAIYIAAFIYGNAHRLYHYLKLWRGDSVVVHGSYMYKSYKVLHLGE